MNPLGRRVLESRVFATRGTFGNNLMRRIYSAARLSVEGSDGTYISSSAISSAVHFDTGPLHQDRFGVDAIIQATADVRRRFPDIGTIYVLGDREFDLPDVRLVQVPDAGCDELLDRARSGERMAVILAFQSDEQLFRYLPRLQETPNLFYFGAAHLFPASRYLNTDDHALAVLRVCEKEIKSWSPYFYLGDSENLIQALSATRNLDGDYVEVGVFQGKSAIVALEYMKATGINRRAFLLDTFKGFQYEVRSGSGNLNRGISGIAA